MAWVLTRARLLRCVDGLLVSHAGAHSVRLALGRALVSHRRRCGAARAGISVRARNWLRRHRDGSWRHELSLRSRVHLHLRRCNHHTLRPRYELRLYHHGCSHVARLLRHVLRVVREASVLAHVRSVGYERLHHGLSIRHLCGRVHSRRVDRCLRYPRRGK